MVLVRLVNWPDTLAELGFPQRWNPDHFVQLLHRRCDQGAKVFSGAFIVGTNGVAMDKTERTRLGEGHPRAT